MIAAFNPAHPVEELLEAYGYKRCGKRWISPTSSSGLAGVTILDGRVYSHHASDPLADGHAHDAFDLFRILDHEGDTRSAVKAAAEELGIESPSFGGVRASTDYHGEVAGCYRRRYRDRAWTDRPRQCAPLRAGSPRERALLLAVGTVASMERSLLVPRRDRRDPPARRGDDSPDVRGSCALIPGAARSARQVGGEMRVARAAHENARIRSSDRGHPDPARGHGPGRVAA